MGSVTVPTGRTKIALTGNPFVDTGLGVIAALSQLDDVSDLTFETIRQVHGDGKRFASRVAHMKSFSQIFGTNNPLFQTGYGYQKGKGPSPKNLEVYQRTLQAFLDAIPDEGEGPRCEACGVRTNFDFARACSEAVEASGGLAPENKRIGRDWFPLAGSLGSDAQALPAASRAVRLCARCLFAVQYLPLGVTLLEGRLAVFQSTSTELWYELVRSITDDALSRVSAGNAVTLGSKEGSSAALNRLLTILERLQRANRLQGGLQGVAVQVWRFSNAGTSPDCQVEDIPNPALAFLWKAIGHGLRREIEGLVAREGKGQSLYRCILSGQDYAGLYPRGKSQGADPKLFALYQTEVCARPARALTVAHTLATEALAPLTEKEVGRLQRQEALSERPVRDRFRNIAAQLAREHRFTLEDYLTIFPYADDDSGFAVSTDGWEIIRYYLHNNSSSYLVPNGLTAVTAHSSRQVLLEYYAATILDAYVAQYGKSRFDSEVLSRMERGTVGTSWLQRRFTHLADSYSGFTYAMWTRLVGDSGRNAAVWDVLFQMRLLWLGWQSAPSIPALEESDLSDGSGLPLVVEDTLRVVIATYIDRRGPDRLERDILLRLRRHEIGLPWFRDHLVASAATASPDTPFTEEEWDNFLRDEEGGLCMAERLFQMHLFVANLYREKNANREAR